MHCKRRWLISRHNRGRNSRRQIRNHGSSQSWFLRRLIRTFVRGGQNSDVWPVVLLLFAVLVPAVCLLWFMSAAMRNERFAARQTLADAYRSQLSSSQVRLEQYWNEATAELETFAQATPPSAAFAKCVQSGRVDSVLVFDEQGNILYPNTPSAPLTTSAERMKGRDYGELEPKWAEASRLEYLQKDFVAAAGRYDALAKESTNVNVAARALQAQARCLVQAGQKDTAIRLVDKILGQERYSHAVDAQGRVIAANAELMALELLTNQAAPVFQAVAQRLKQRLLDYDNPLLAASQRRFLMKELQWLSPQIEFPKLAAEELAAQVTESHPKFLEIQRTGARHRFSLSPQRGQGRGEGWEPPDRLTGSNVSEPHHPSPSIPLPVEGRGKFALQRSVIPGMWQFTTPDRRVLALVRSERLLANLRPVTASSNPAAEMEIALLPPEADPISALATLPAGEPMPGWRLALSLKDPGLFDTTTEHRAAIYLWTGILVVAAMGVLALLAVRLLRRQVALARLKNDLAATVSHELKTPLSSMRVLVDTLLDSDRIEEKKAREYLQLIAKENDRLSRVIQNFLTFSRMERRMHTFDFVSVPPGQIIDAAVGSVRERFDVPGCHFELQIEENLPDVTADADALATALINLLDNACKYSEDIKHITLKACARDGQVVFSVRDNGVGIATREAKRIFQPFHQVDQRLSRKGSGCGLGLSIVQHIVNAHRGSVSVESQPGAGSTFTLCLPAALPATPLAPCGEEGKKRREV
jgi:signal transduction histidine kinase